MLNVGVMSIRPSLELFDAANDALQFRSHEAELPEQVFFSEFFNISTRAATSMPKSSFQWVGAEFNSCVDKARVYAGLLNPVIHHMCADEKALLLPMCSWTGDGITTNQTTAEHCKIPWVRELQQLQLASNPCNGFGQNVSTCSSASSCQWCDEYVRCIPSSQQCMLHSKATRALSRRYEPYIRHGRKLQLLDGHYGHYGHYGYYSGYFGGFGSGGCCLWALSAGDPHMMGADGDTFSVRGSNLGIYNLLSHSGRHYFAPDITFNAEFEDVNFRSTMWPKFRVNGSFIRKAFLVLRLPGSDRQVRVAYDARQTSNVQVDGRTDVLWDGSPEYQATGGVRMHLRKGMLTIETPQWRIQAKSTRTRPHMHRTRMNIRITSVYPVCEDPVSPHGMLGQTFDCDGAALHGKKDQYKPAQGGGTATTEAQGEGAMEGDLSDYQVASPFDGGFTFSRFNAAAPVPARNARKLSGRLVPHSRKQLLRRRKLSHCRC